MWSMVLSYMKSVIWPRDTALTPPTSSDVTWQMDPRQLLTVRPHGWISY